MNRTPGIRRRIGHQRPGGRAQRYAIAPSWQRVAGACLLLALIGLVALAAPADPPGVVAQLDISKAGPRKIEAQTEGRILADYRLAWSGIAQAMSANDSGALEALFVGSAKKWLDDRITGQQRSGIRTRYSNQSHSLQAVFYAPEGDLMELHDTAEYDTQVVAAGKVIHEDHGAHRYVVLMTPGADRWVIRELTEVAQF